MLSIDKLSLDYARITRHERSRFIETDQPVFSWSVRSDRHDASQSACRVSVFHGASTLWDSGWVHTSEQRLVYAGVMLPRGRAVDFAVEVEDDQGNRCEPAVEKLYDARVEWDASWISADEDRRGETVYFRRDLEIRAGLIEACLYACGIGYHKLFLNGVNIDDNCLEPAHTDYSKTCQYVMSPNLAEQFLEGINCLGVMLGEGWRRNCVTDGRNGRAITFAGVPAFSAMLRLRYADGCEEWVRTGADWQCGRGAVVRNDLFSGETYDARCDRPGWNHAGFLGFGAARVVDAPGGDMRPMLLPPITWHKEREPMAAWPAGVDRWIVDYGQNLAGVIRIALPDGMRPGQSIRLLHAEELDEDGTLFRAPLRDAKAEDVYIASGDARDLGEWQPVFTYHGFRYAQVEGMGPDFALERLTAVELHTDLEQTGFFRCGDALVTRIHELCVETERHNMHGILTDCPQRDERQGWMNDATVRFEETPYNFDMGRMFPKIVRDIMDTQGENGAICCTAPFVWGYNPADPVCSSYLVAAMQALLHDGNERIVAEGYEGYKAWTEFLLSRSVNGIVNYSYYGDWAAPAYACVQDDHCSAVSLVTPGEFMSTGYAYFNCRTLAAFARQLGKDQDERRYSVIADGIRGAMLGKWYDRDSASIATNSHACRAFTLWLGLLPKDDAQRMADALAEDLAACDYQFTTGNLCTRYLLDVLAEHGHLEDAWRLMTKQDYPSLGYMLQQEATTVWERFELKKHPGMNSHSHPMYAAADYWLYAFIAGIRPLAPGWRCIRVKPYMPKNLLSAQATVKTPMGDVSVRWVRRYGATHLMVSVPFGARARVEFGEEAREVGSGFHTFSALSDR